METADDPVVNLISTRPFSLFSFTKLGVSQWTKTWFILFSDGNLLQRKSYVTSCRANSSLPYYHNHILIQWSPSYTRQCTWCLQYDPYRIYSTFIRSSSHSLHTYQIVGCHWSSLIYPYLQSPIISLSDGIFGLCSYFILIHARSHAGSLKRYERIHCDMTKETSGYYHVTFILQWFVIRPFHHRVSHHGAIGTVTIWIGFESESIVSSKVWNHRHFLSEKIFYEIVSESTI